MSSALWLMTGPTSTPSSQPGPRRSCSAALTRRRLQVLVDPVLRDHARGGGAALAGGAERRPDDPLDREVEVGVVEDDDRVLAAELEVDVLEVVSGVPHHLHPGLARAGKRDHGHVRVLDEPVADRTTAAVDDVHDAGRNSSLGEQLDEALTQKRRVGRGLEDDRVPADERRCDLPGGNRDREVPRRDHADDADRLAHAHVELVLELGRGRLAEQAPAFAAHVEAHVDCFLNVASGLGEHLAHLAGHQLRDLVLLVGEQPAEAEEDLAAARGRDKAPFLVGGLRGVDGLVDVLGARAREDAERLAGRRALRLEGLARRSVDPLAADVVLEALCRVVAIAAF